MANRLLLVVVLLSFVGAILSLECYVGYGRECVIDDMTDCGNGKKCICIKYRYKCSQMDTGCSAEDRANDAYQWGFEIHTQEDCEEMKKPSFGLSDVSCCSTRKCNRPTSRECLNLAKS